MNASAISSVLTCIFLIFLILGFLFGLWRGFSKSLTRLLIVVVIAVVSFFAVPAISKSILSANISSWNIQIGDVVVQSLDQLITDSLTNINQVKDLMEASPTFTEFIQAVPLIIVNLVLFILFFLVAKLVSMIIYWILCAILFPKKKTAGKNKHRFVGAVIGAIQGLLVAVVLFIPVFGLMNVSNTAQIALSQSQTELQQSIEGSTPQTIVATSDSDENNDENSNTIDNALQTVTNYTKALESNFIYKTLNTVGLINLSNSIFDELTTVEANGKEYKFTIESVEISKMYPYLNLLLESEFNIQDNEFIDKLILLVDKSYNSPLIGDIVTEIIKEAATIWSDTSIERDQRLFLGMATPDLGSQDLNTVFDEQLNVIKNSSKEDLKTKLVDVLKVAKVANETIKLAEDVKQSLSEISPENLENIFTAIVENETIKDVIKDVVTTDTLDEFGISDVGTQTLIVDVVNKIVDADEADIKKEVAATKEIFALTEKINEAQDLNTTVTLETNEVESLVDGFANSTIITELIKTKQNEETQEGVANPIKDLDISNSLHPDTKSALEEEINTKITDEELKATLEQILLGKTQEQE